MPTDDTMLFHDSLSVARARLARRHARLGNERPLALPDEHAADVGAAVGEGAGCGVGRGKLNAGVGAGLGAGLSVHVRSGHEALDPVAALVLGGVEREVGGLQQVGGLDAEIARPALPGSGALPSSARRRARASAGGDMAGVRPRRRNASAAISFSTTSRRSRSKSL